MPNISRSKQTELWNSHHRRPGRWLAGFGTFMVILVAWLAGRPTLSAQSDGTSQTGSAAASIMSVSDASYQFGQAITFSLAATSKDGPIEQVTLFFQVPESANTFTAEIEVEPSRKIAVEHMVDLTQLRLAPFTNVTYWWWVAEADGGGIYTDQQKLLYADDQFEWQELVQGPLAVHWAGSDVTLGQKAIDAVTVALPRIQEWMPVSLDEPLEIYIYPTAADLRAALRLTGRDWVGAHAHPELGVILVAAADGEAAAGDLKQALPHEVSHHLFYQATGLGYDSAPVWLDEGLAAVLDDSSDPNYELILQEAVATDNTIPFADLCRSFPEDPQQVLLAYAQSASLVDYLQSIYGNGVLSGMVQALADGADCQTVVSRVLDMSLAELNQEWLEQQMPQSTADRLWQRGGVWLLLITGGFVVTLFMVLHNTGPKGGENHG